MKTFLIVLASGLLSGMVSLSAQSEEFIANQPSYAPEIISESTSSRPEISGVVAAMFNNPQPLQMINPLAPKKYGNGEKYVSRDPNDPSKPKGIIVLSLEW